MKHGSEEAGKGAEKGGEKQEYEKKTERRAQVGREQEGGGEKLKNE
jgi:hypothetical protein